MGISVSDRKMNSLLAKALRTDLNKSVELSMKTVGYIVGDAVKWLTMQMSPGQRPRGKDGSVSAMACLKSVFRYTRQD